MPYQKTRQQMKMRILYGFVGALLGAVFGGATLLLVVSIATSGEAFAVAFTMVIFGWVAMLIGALIGITAALYTFGYIHGNRSNRITSRQKNVLIASLSIGIPILSFGVSWSALRLGGPPSDQQLLSNFHQNRSTFDQLVQMVQADKGVSKIDDVSMGAENTFATGIAPARIATYRRLMTSLGIARGLDAPPQADGIDFNYFANGSVIAGSETKGYAYMTTQPDHQVNDLDQFQRSRQDGVTAYRHIQGNWYIFYIFQDG